MTEALENCRKTGAAPKDLSMEAHKASNLIEIMLRKVQNLFMEAAQHQRSSYPTPLEACIKAKRSRNILRP